MVQGTDACLSLAKRHDCDVGQQPTCSSYDRTVTGDTEGV